MNKVQCTCACSQIVGKVIAVESLTLFFQLEESLQSGIYLPLADSL